MNEKQLQYYSEFVKAMQEIDMSDRERGHGIADQLLIDFLHKFDYPQLAEAYEKKQERFWYA